MFGLPNLIFGVVSGSAFSNTDTSLNLKVSHGARFETALLPMRAVLWNFTDYKDPAEARWDGSGDVEYIQIDARTGDVLTTVQRGLEGLPAISGKAGKEYRIAVVATRGQWDKTCRAHPDGTSGFDAQLVGTPAAVANMLARFTKDDGANDAVFSIQGSDAEGDNTELWLGDTATPENSRLQMTKSAAATDRLSLIMNALSMITVEGRGRLGFRKAAPNFQGGINFGAPISFDKLFGMSTGAHTISGGVISGVETNFITVSAEGGPGSDELDTINLASGFSPGQRMILLLEPQTTAHLITVKDGTGNIFLGAEGDFLMNADNYLLALIGRDTGNNSWQELFRVPRIPGYVMLQDQKPQNTDSGTFTSGSWQTRDINTELSDLRGIASISANQVTLQPGTWIFGINCRAYQVDRHQARLQNITDASTALLGTSARTNAGVFASNRSHIAGLVSFSSAKTFEVQHQCSQTRNNDGFGDACNFTTEVYLTFEAWRISE